MDSARQKKLALAAKVLLLAPAVGMREKNKIQ